VVGYLDCSRAAELHLVQLRGQTGRTLAHQSRISCRLVLSICKAGAWLRRARSGNDQPSNSISFDVPKLNGELLVLFEYLEITYDNVLRTLTTFPYWLTFGGRNNSHTPHAVRGSTPRVSRIYRPTSVGLQRGDRFVSDGS
jgi:hypothetical protein